MGSTVKKIALLSGGGDCPGLNAVIRTITKTAISKYGYEVIGFVYGYRGLYHNNYVELTEESVEDIYKEGGTILYSSNKDNLFNYMVEKNGVISKEDVSDVAIENMKKEGVDVLVVIGGDGTLTSARDFARKGVNVIGVPKTIDNDLVVTDHTPGFGSAARYVAASVLEMAHDTYIYNTKSVLIAEIMGRDAGWLTAASVLARNSYSRAPHLIYLPEHPFSKEQFIEDIKAQFKQREHIVIAVSEGLRDGDGHYISAETAAVDAFGHATLSGTGKCLEGLVAEKFGCKVRSVEINVLQRCAAHMASATDIEESWQLGLKGVALALEGKSGEMSIVCRISDEPYQVIYDGADVQQIANAEKKIPTAWINEAGNDVTEEMVRYLRPLIHGSVAVPEQDSMPHYLFLGEAL